MDCWQPTGSFKIRGIGHICNHYVERGAKKFISSSGGNAGLAVAFAGASLKIETIVVVPKTTDKKMLKIIEDEGARVIVHGEVWDESHIFALKLAEDEESAYIHPFDHPEIWKGHATIIDEVVQQIEKPDLIVLSVGGGGLLCGVTEGLQNNNVSNIPIIAVETSGSASYYKSMLHKKHITLDTVDTVATSLGAKRVATEALNRSSEFNILPVIVSDKEAVAACLQFADCQKTLVEPACGAALSIVFSNHQIIADAKNILIVVCGGVGVSLNQLNIWKNRFKI